MFTLQRFLFLFSLCSASQLACTQPATFDNGILTIPQGAAIVNGEPEYYNDIQLKSDTAGNLSLLAAQLSNLVSVDTVVVNIAESLPVQVFLTITGSKSVPCVQLQAPAIFRDDSTFTVVLAETSLGPAETCIAVLDPFETSVILEVTDLDAGSYSVSVNGVEANFDL